MIGFVAAVRKTWQQSRTSCGFLFMAALNPKQQPTQQKQIKGYEGFRGVKGIERFGVEGRERV